MKCLACMIDNNQEENTYIPYKEKQQKLKIGHDKKISQTLWLGAE